jgi:hypothetical protein
MGHYRNTEVYFMTDNTKTEENVVFVSRRVPNIQFGEIPDFPQGWKRPDSYAIELPASTLKSLADYAREIREGK